jgi:hypothetical protein
MGGPWVFCDRCGVKTLVSQTKRQFGFLFCIPNNCVDKWILGQREARTAQVVAMLPGREMQPVPKVTMEDSNDAGLDAIQFGF